MIRPIFMLVAHLLANTPMADDNKPPPLPPEAFAACEGKSSGDACTVQFHDKTINGNCSSLPDDGRLFCRPNGPPPPSRREGFAPSSSPGPRFAAGPPSK